jgi:hypothetical protein
MRTSRSVRPNRSALLGTDKSDCNIRDVDLSISACCFFCRDSIVSLDPALSVRGCEVRKCDRCNTVQDFLLPQCPHPKCVGSDRVGSWTLRGAPSTMVHRHFFCTAEHADDTFDVPASISIYLDSQQEALVKTNEQSSLPMHFTVQMFLEQVLTMCEPLFNEAEVPDAADREYVVCIDTERRPGGQMNVLHNDSLLYLEIQRYKGTGIIIFEASEYAAQCNTGAFSIPSYQPDLVTYDMPDFFELEGLGDAADLFFPLEEVEAIEEDPKFWLEYDHPEAIVRKWCNDRNITGNRVLERGTVGPRPAKQAFAIPVLCTNDEVDMLLAGGYSPAMICPYMLRNKQVLVIMSLGRSDDNSAELRQTQSIVCEELTNAYLIKGDRSKFVSYMLDYQRQFGLGTMIQADSGAPSSQYVVNVDQAMPIEMEEEVEEPVPQKKPFAGKAPHKFSGKAPRRVIVEEEDEDEEFYSDDFDRNNNNDDDDDDDEDEDDVVVLTPLRKRQMKRPVPPPPLPSGNKKKRQRTETVKRAANEIYDMFKFARKECPKIVRLVKKGGINPAPFAIERGTMTGRYFVCVPLRTALARDIDQQFVTSEVYMRYRMVMVDCGTDMANRDAVCAYLSIHSLDLDFVDRLNEVLQNGGLLPRPVPIRK